MYFVYHADGQFASGHKLTCFCWIFRLTYFNSCGLVDSDSFFKNIKAKLGIELFRACYNRQRVLSYNHFPNPNLYVAKRCCLC